MVSASHSTEIVFGLKHLFELFLDQPDLSANYPVDSLDEDENEDDSNPDLYSSATRKRRLGATESTQRDNIFGSGIGADKSDSSQGSPAEEVGSEESRFICTQVRLEADMQI